MARFEEAIGFVLQHEGGYTVDHAGPTKFGITQPTLDRFRDAHPEFIAPSLTRNLTRTQATEIYRRLWWGAYNYGQIEHQVIATKVFDLSVNMGPRAAHKLLQRACNTLRQVPLAVDGVLGPMTMGATNALASYGLLIAIRRQAEMFYLNLVKRNPDKYARFKNGWIARARA